MKPVAPQESIAEAMRWVSRITNIGLSVAVPALIGYGVDLWQHTTPWGVVAGGLLGGMAGLQQILLLTKSLSASTSGGQSAPSRDSDRG